MNITKSNLDLDMVVYSAEKTTGEKRNNLVASLIGGYAANVFESLLYGYADKLCHGYSGGFWEIVGVTSGGQSIAFYFYPDIDEAVKVDCLGFQCDIETTAKAAGAAFTLMSLSQLSFFLHSKGESNAATATADVYHELRGYIFTSGDFSEEERTAIYKITD